jgi:molybdopterin synthase catalytic subunit
MHIEILELPFEPLETLAHYQQARLEKQGKYGATACFIGTMRDFNEGDQVQCMHLEHYPGMTEKYLYRILEDAQQRWSFLDALVVHRVGKVYPNDPIVLITVWSAHRAAAFDACRFIIEALKSQAPFWKNETLAEGQRWVAKNTVG